MALIAADRVAEPGRIFVVGEGGIGVNDAFSDGEVLELEENVHFITLGPSTHLDFEVYEFCLMESGRIIAIDELDAAILEIASVEIA